MCDIPTFFSLFSAIPVDSVLRDKDMRHEIGLGDGVRHAFGKKSMSPGHMSTQKKIEMDIGGLIRLCVASLQGT